MTTSSNNGGNTSDAAVVTTANDATYRKHLETELERLTQDLAEIRMEREQQKKRIQEMQHEQCQLKDQLQRHHPSSSSSSSGGNTSTHDRELQSGLVSQMTNLSHLVQVKTREHLQVQQEWERSQEQYTQLQRTVALLRGSVVSDLLEQHRQRQEQQQHDDDLSLKHIIVPRSSSSGGDVGPNDSGSSLRASFVGMFSDETSPNNTSFFTNSTNTVHRTNNKNAIPPNQQGEGKNDTFHPSQYLWDDNDDSHGTNMNYNQEAEGGDEEYVDDDEHTTLTDYTKDSLQIHAARQAARKVAREKQHQRDQQHNQEYDQESHSSSSSASSGSLGKHFSKQTSRRTTATTTTTNKSEASSSGNGSSSQSSSLGKSSSKSLSAHFSKSKNNNNSSNMDQRTAQLVSTSSSSSLRRSMVNLMSGLDKEAAELASQE